MITVAQNENNAAGVAPKAWLRRLRNNGNLLLGAAVLILFLIVMVLAHLLGAADPQAMTTSERLHPPSLQHWFGTDRLGRDIYARVAFGTSASLAVGAAAAALGCIIGTIFGLAAGYFRSIDMLIMRVMDGIMAIPGIMIAIATISVAGASITTVVLAIAVHDVPRIARLVRSSVLSMREEPYVEAAVMLGSPSWSIVLRHMLPGILASLAVLGTYVAANAMLLEATLSFLGCGLPPDIPTWGNIMADGRILFRIAPWIILFPGAVLAFAVLAINLLGDGLRDQFDPTTEKTMR
ncbi:ABC transporter permease [Bradyrhizobium sp. dw_78]|uniref:ABC transporter permease n=1 Tax=Bradyrhizobium sp. dw_78 TaxID=2719793 RepID=UPI00201C941E|nr:ABC transporter permease [Bradyrhizobium sp. dw_78]